MIKGFGAKEDMALGFVLSSDGKNFLRCDKKGNFAKFADCITYIYVAILFQMAIPLQIAA